VEEEREEKGVVVVRKEFDASTGREEDFYEPVSFGGVWAARFEIATEFSSHH